MVDDAILSYIRYNVNSDDLYLVILNLGSEAAERDYSRPMGNPAITVSYNCGDCGYYGGLELWGGLQLWEFKIKEKPDLPCNI